MNTAPGPDAKGGSLLIAGTTSDAGKSLITSAVCRALSRRGLKVAPFKAQNMSNNSMVIPAAQEPVNSQVQAPTALQGNRVRGNRVQGDEIHGHGVQVDGIQGAEIGRAQWIQALAAGAEPEPAMNPVLLKPGSDQAGHAIVMGQPAGAVAAADFRSGRKHLAEAAHAAFDELSSRFDVVVCEGAGSPAEINLRDTDYVNMGLAQHGRIPTVVVGDIDRGGVFAALYGTLALLSGADQQLVAGFILNKFRGDVSLLKPAMDHLSDVTSRPFFGVLPWHDDVWFDAEDGLALGPHRANNPDALRVRVIKFPRISNFTDADALGLEPGVDLQFIADPRDCHDADLIILPGTRATLTDLDWLVSRGLDVAIRSHAAAGKPVLGICGGFQMLGQRIDDPSGVEAAAGASAPGLGLLDVRAVFSKEKTLNLPRGMAFGQQVNGYQIHHGRIELGCDAEFLGGAQRGAVFGTMWHGSLESDRFRGGFLAHIAQITGKTFDDASVDFTRARHTRLDLLADLAEQYLDVDALLELAQRGVPAFEPVGPGGRQ